MLGLDSRRLFKKSSAFKKIIRNKYLLESLTPLTSCSEIETYPVEVVSLAYSGNELGRNVLTSKVPHRDLNYTAPRCHRMLHGLWDSRHQSIQLVEDLPRFWQT